MPETLNARVTRIEKTMAKLADLSKVLLSAQIATEERFKQTEQQFQQTDARIEKLVSAVGELISRMPPRS